MVPTFQQINEGQKPFGTYDLYSSMAISDDASTSFKVRTLTLTICKWEWKNAYKLQTRIHRIHSECKIRVDKDEWDYCRHTLAKAISYLNSESSVPARNAVIELIGKKKWGIISDLLPGENP